jgi:hypothetical protein
VGGGFKTAVRYSTQASGEKIKEGGGSKRKRIKEFHTNRIKIDRTSRSWP